MTISPDEIKSIGVSVREAQEDRARQAEEARVARLTRAREDGLAVAERVFRSLPTQVVGLRSTGTALEVLSVTDVMTRIAAYHLLTWAKEAGITLDFGTQEGRVVVVYVDPTARPDANPAWKSLSWPTVDGA